MKGSPELKNQVVSTCLEYVRQKEGDGVEKERILKIIKALPQSESMINTLSQRQRNLFYILMDCYYSFRDAYLDLVALPDYKKLINEDFDINSFLLMLIPKVVLADQTHDAGISKFNVLLLLDFLKSCPKFDKHFINKWREKAKQKKNLRIREKQRILQAEEAASGVKKVQIPKQTRPPEPTPQPLDQSEQKQSPVQPKPKQKTQQELAKEAKQRQRENQKEAERQKELERKEKLQRQNEEKRKMEERRQREQNQKKSDIRERENFRNLKGKVLEKYIDSRKDLHCEKSKSKDIGEYLAAKLDQFLKTTLEHMYDIACLKNKKNPKLGNELSYFADQNDRVQITQEFYFQPNTKIQSLTYKHKHQIYSSLRIKEIKKEDDLRSALQAKTNEGEKKIDKRIENYILKPRPKDTEGMLVPFREEKDGYRSQGVAISIEHAIYFLENHPWLKSSLLLFEVYHLY